MTTVMPGQDLVVNMIRGAMQRAIDDINGEDGQRNSASKVEEPQLRSLRSWINNGRDNDYIADHYKNRAEFARNPVHIMDGPPDVDPAIWPGPIEVPESQYAKAAGDDMEKKAAAVDQKFAELLDAFEDALKPHTDGNTYLWTGELLPDDDYRTTTVGEAISAYNSALAVFHDDSADYQKARSIDRQNTPVPPIPWFDD